MLRPKRFTSALKEIEIILLKALPSEMVQMKESSPQNTTVGSQQRN